MTVHYLELDRRADTRALRADLDRQEQAHTMITCVTECAFMAEPEHVGLLIKRLDEMRRDCGDAGVVDAFERVEAALHDAIVDYDQSGCTLAEALDAADLVSLREEYFNLAEIHAKWNDAYSLV